MPITKRRRDRRTPHHSAHSNQPIPIVPSTPRCPFSYNLSFTLLLFFSFLLATSFTLYPSLLRHLTPSPPPNATSSVYDRGLVKPNVAYQQIINESGKVSENRTRRHFPNPVLAYITPWNSKGYEMAKLFSSKFSHLSPVWYELKSNGKMIFMDGQHNADMGWISELRKNGHSLVLPRVVLELVPADLLQKKQWSKAIDIIVTECNE